MGMSGLDIHVGVPATAPNGAFGLARVTSAWLPSASGNVFRNVQIRTFPPHSAGPTLIQDTNDTPGLHQANQASVAPVRSDRRPGATPWAAEIEEQSEVLKATRGGLARVR